MKTFKLNKLPFYWRMRNSLHDKNIVPDTLPLIVNYDSELALFKQKQIKKNLTYLEQIYKQFPNIGHNQEMSNWKNYYGNDIYDFIKKEIHSLSFPVQNILEIGSGGCVVLEMFKKEGYSVMGIDPSPFSKKEGSKKGITVIEGFFPSKEITATYDVIYHSNVLEHIPDPLTFLRHQFNHLKENGLTVMAVPDCTDCLHYGDISIFYHQHLFFFSIESLTNLVQKAGFSNIRVERSAYGGNLYVSARKKSVTKYKKIITSTDAFDSFHTKKNILFHKFKTHVKRVMNDKNRTLGFYAPLRVLPYITKMNLFSGFRLFDDTSYWHNTYFDGVDVIIENFEDLQKKPVTDVIIMSPTFGDVIAKKIQKHFHDSIQIKKITDFYNL